MSSEAIYYTAQQLAEKGKEEIPSELIRWHSILPERKASVLNVPPWQCRSRLCCW